MMSSTERFPPRPGGPPGSGTPKGDRADNRRAIWLPLRVSVAGSTALQRRAAADISDSGMLIVPPLEAEVGELVVIDADPHLQRVEARVVGHHRKGTGVAFVNPIRSAAIHIAYAPRPEIASPGRTRPTSGGGSTAQDDRTPEREWWRTDGRFHRGSPLRLK